jgi:hypothetical protein
MKIMKFNEENETEYTISNSAAQIWQDFYNAIATDWAKNDEDYPEVEKTADACLEIVKKYIKTNKKYNL